MNKVRVRFGLRTGNWFFPNAAIFVRRTDEEGFDRIFLAVSQIATVLRSVGWGDVADRLVCERS